MTLSCPISATTAPELRRKQAALLALLRPATLFAAVAPVGVGTALAFADGAMVAPVAACALLGALFIQIGTNLFNDYADFFKGADGAGRLGPPRAIAQGWVQPKEVLLAACTAFALATGCGAYLAWYAGWPIVAIGLTSLLAGYAYTAGPYPLGYHGLGDIFVLVFFGPVAVGGTYFAQAHRLSGASIVAGVALGCICTAILVVNNLRDRHTDVAASKRTLAVRFGAGFAQAQYATLLVTAHVLPFVAVACGMGRLGWLLPTLLLPYSYGCARAVYKLDGAALNIMLGKTGRLLVLFGALLGTGAAMPPLGGRL